MPSKTSPGLARAERRIRFHDVLKLGAILLAALVLLSVLAVAAHAVLVLFAGLLLGVLLDACIRGLQWAAPIGRLTALTASCVVLAGLLTGGIVWGGYQIVAQADAIVEVMSEQLESWQEEFAAIGIGEEDEEDGEAEETPENETDMQTVGRFLVPDVEDWGERMGSAFTTTFGVLGDLVIILFAGIFIAARPQLYRDGLLSLIPPRRRARVGSVLDEIASSLRWWLVGQLFAMVLVGTTVGIAMALIGMPSALLLGLQAGLLMFIPYVGPLIAAVPVALVALADGTEMFVWAMLVYLAIQNIEGYLVTPLIHQRAISLAPLLTLGAIMIFGILFGVIGVILAMPLAAAIRILVIRFYVEDTLGDRDPARREYA